MRHPVVFNIWRQRRDIGQQWGWCYTVGYEFDDEAIAIGWRATLEEAEAIVARHMAEAEKTKQPWE
jgi:hypothetical protein